jgi:H(+)-transporting ATP synthase subunit D
MSSLICPKAEQIYNNPRVADVAPIMSTDNLACDSWRFILSIRDDADCQRTRHSHSPFPPCSKVKFRDYAKDIAENKATMGVDAANAFFSMTQAEYAAGNFKQKVAEGTLTARVRVGAGINNVAGVKLPVFSKYETNVATDNHSLGLAGGGKKIAAVREKFTVLLEKLLKLASLQTSFVTLDEALKVTNRRVNALENVTIPKIDHVLDYIARELDELEREGKRDTWALGSR